MSKEKTREPKLTAVPAAEGVCFRRGGVVACAVRNRQKDISVRVVRQDPFPRDLLERIPLIRGAARLFTSVGDFFGALNMAQTLEPRDAIRGGGFARRFARLFRTRPQSLAALVSGAAIVLILIVMLAGLPLLAEMVLGLIEGVPRFAVNAVCCMFRLLGVVLSVYMICRLKVMNRLCMYRGAAAKVINACEAYGPGLTYEEAALSPRLTDKSDGAFLLTVLAASIIAWACMPERSLWIQLVSRLGILLAAAAVLDELILPLENADPNNAVLIALRSPLTGLQHLFTIEPHNQMIEVAVCAFQAVRDGDSDGQ